MTKPKTQKVLIDPNRPGSILFYTTRFCYTG